MWPRSVLGLVLIGFSFVALPLLFATLRAGIAVDDLAARSQRLVMQGVRVTRVNERLAEQITDMERYVRQYYVVGDRALWGLFLENKALFGDTLRRLRELDDDRRLASPIARLHALGVQLDERIPPRGEPAPVDAPHATLDRFAELRTLASSITNNSNAFIDAEVEQLERAAARSRRELSWQAIALVPITIGLTATFTLMIAQPIRRLTAAITHLGEQGFDAPIAISGPPELQALGARLDWLRQRLRDADETKNTFLRHMSHELKTPLASLREGTELLTDGTVGQLNATQQEVANIALENCLKLQALIENLLDFTAWQHDASRLRLSAFDLRTLVDACLAQHGLEIRRKQLTVAVSGAAFELRGDRLKLRTAIDNLVANAVRFSPPAGTIRVAVERDDANARIDVMDEGPGIPAAERKLVFEPFFRGAADGPPGLRGTGIGLSVVRECARAHGGTIDIVDSPGTGGHLRLSLPIAAQAHPDDV